MDDLPAPLEIPIARDEADIAVGCTSPGSPAIVLDTIANLEALDDPSQSQSHPQPLKFAHRSRESIAHARAMRIDRVNKNKLKVLELEAESLKSDLDCLSTSALNAAILGKRRFGKCVGRAKNLRAANFKSIARAAFMRMKSKIRGLGVNHDRIVAAGADMIEARQKNGIKRVHGFYYILFQICFMS